MFLNQFGNWFIQDSQLQCLSIILYFRSFHLINIPSNYFIILSHLIFQKSYSNLCAHPLGHGMIGILEIFWYISSYDNEIKRLNNSPNVETYFHKIFCVGSIEAASSGMDLMIMTYFPDSGRCTLLMHVGFSVTTKRQKNTLLWIQYNVTQGTFFVNIILCFQNSCISCKIRISK